jgi:glycopeptide antibiotics resistance protein
MNLWLALAIFVLSITDDIAVVIYLRRVVAGKRKSAALLSGGLTLLISLEVFIYVSDWIYLFPNAIGSVIGTWIALCLEERLPKQTPRTSKGRFKTPPPKLLQVEKEIL